MLSGTLIFKIGDSPPPWLVFLVNQEREKNPHYVASDELFKIAT
jgi:hypothetical protein